MKGVRLSRVLHFLPFKFDILHFILLFGYFALSLSL